MSISRIGIVGAGTMGAGIAQAFAVHPQFEIILCDVELTYAEKGRENIAKALKRQAERGRIDKQEAQAALERIAVGLNESLSDCDLIIEAAPENLQLKKKLFLELQEICKKDAVFATNTSSLSITELSLGLDRPLIGMHFFNPAPVMKLVEVVVGLTTPPELTERIKQLALAIEKTPVEVKDSPGFVVNRILIPLINEAVAIYAEGVASAEDIDTAMQLGANHPMGPLALGDLIGLDVCLAIMEVLQSESGDPKYRPHPLLRKMVRAHHLGRKTGRGFFDYQK